MTQEQSDAYADELVGKEMMYSPVPSHWPAIRVRVHSVYKYFPLDLKERTKALFWECRALYHVELLEQKDIDMFKKSEMERDSNVPEDMKGRFIFATL